MFNANSWPIIGRPAPGTVAALAVGRCEGYTVFAGTRTGLYRTSEVHSRATVGWQRLLDAPLEIIALGISPNYATDATLIAGTGQGLFVSRDGGDHWQAAHTPMSDTVVLCLAFSPNYAVDGIMLAGTLEDGIYYSDSRGAQWSYRSFGLLDATIYALAFSPNFACDETIFAGSETALYYSYNGARAWKLLDFPEEAAPILSLALSSYVAQDQTLYAGTEQHGLYQSANLGKSWQKVDLPVICVNTLVISPEDGSLFAATDAGIYSASDEGKCWLCLFNQPDAFSLALSDNIVIASLVNQGAWVTSDRTTWRPFFTLPVRSLTGMVLSPRFHRDAVAFLFGPQEGIWRTQNGGLSWSCLNDTLPSLDIRSIALSPNFAQNRVLVAATPDGLLLSEDAGDHWALLAETPLARVAFAPGGQLVAIASQAGEIWMANALKAPWQSVTVPWGQQSQVLACAIDDNGRISVALLDQAQESVSIWEGKPGQFVQILVQTASSNPVVNFCSLPPSISDIPWYASLDNQVWEFQRAPTGIVSANLIFETEDGSRVLSLIASQSRSPLFACTSQVIYQSKEINSWEVVHHFGDEMAIALALSPAYPDDATAFALLLGGSFCRGILK